MAPSIRSSGRSTSRARNASRWSVRRSGNTCARSSAPMTFSISCCIVFSSDTPAGTSSGEDRLHRDLEAWEQPRRCHCSPAILAGQLVNTLLQHVDLDGLGPGIDDPVLGDARFLVHPHFLPPIVQPIAGRE